MDYRLEAEKILEELKAGRPISAIKLVRTVTFECLKESKAVIDFIRDYGIDDCDCSRFAGYLEIRRMTSGACYGDMRTYNLDNMIEYASAVDHLSIILNHERALGVIEGVSMIRGLMRGESITVTLVSSCSYRLHYV